MSDCLPDDLLLDAVDRRLGPDRAAAVAAHLAVCPACRAAADAVAALRHAAAGDVIQPGPSVEANLRRMIRRTAGGRPKSRRRLAVMAGLVAGAVIVALVSPSGWTDRKPARAVAALTLARSKVTLRRGGADQPAESGMALLASDTLTVPEGSAAVVTLPDRSQVEVGPATVIALADAGLELKAGVLEVEAADRPADDPVHIQTPAAEAVSAGGRFTVAAGITRTAVRVAAGEARVTRRRDGAGVLVPAGHRSLITPEAVTSAPSRAGTVLLVVSRENASALWDRFQDQLTARVVGRRVRELAFRIETRSHTDLTPGDLAGRALVVLSFAHEEVGYEDSLRRAGLPAARVPVLCLEPIALPVLGMTGAVRGADFNWSEGDGRVDFPTPGHPLSAGLSGAGMDLGRPFARAGWGRPAAGAVRVVTWPGALGRAVGFAFEPGPKVPARRAALVLNPEGADDAAGPAWALFDAAIDWLAEPIAGGRP